MIVCASLSLTPIAKHYSFREMKRVRMKFINAAHRIIRIGLFPLLLAYLATPGWTQPPVTAQEALTKIKSLAEEKQLSLPALDPFTGTILNPAEATELHALISSALRAAELDSRTAEFEAKELKQAELSMKFEYKLFGEKPTEGRSLFISMHGGGGAPKRVNDGQWQNQIRLYEPKEGVYVAPRAPTDTWNLWHQGHIDPLFTRLIEDMVLFEGVNPDRVYLMGYSAGGDGVYQVAPRMADRFAAASMMAGHPNETEPYGLRNLPFALFMGGNDSAYQRNSVAEKWGKHLDELETKDPTGYKHLVKIYPGKGHWMDREDAEGVPWMAQFTRQRWPKKIVWKQDDVTHTKFYWLEVTPDRAKGGTLINAEVVGHESRLQGSDLDMLTLHLSDELLDLNQPIKVTWNDEICFEGKVERTIGAVQAAYKNDLLPTSPASARIEIVRQARAALHDEELKYWLKNMLVDHQYSVEEAASVLGISPERIGSESERLSIKSLPAEQPTDHVRIAPYPGGRHPRIGFLDGALNPQRETKISVFAPWDSKSYIVLDVPEAIWSNLGLTYLAHTHIPTVWSQQGIQLLPLEWKRIDDNNLQISRTLPNGIRFDVNVKALNDHVKFNMVLFNGTNAPLSDLRVQMCGMLKALNGFQEQTNDNKIFRPPFAACHSADKSKWAIWAWQPIQRAWGNPPCPCLHADPQFPDCPPGESREIQGLFAFYSGTNLESELTRLSELLPN